MITTGRNDPCPCGSGRKYKKCCQRTDDQFDLEYRRQLNAESNLIPVLRELANSALSIHAIEDAWNEFNGDDEVELLEDNDPMNMVFMPWFFFSWAFDPKEYLPDDEEEFEDDDELTDEDDEGPVTIGLIHLAVLHDELPEDQREFLIAANIATYTICEVLEVTPGSRMQIRDLFCERTFEVIERTASQSLKRGELIYCAPMTIRGVVSLLALSPYSLRPTFKVSVYNLRRAILAELDQQTMGDDELAEYEPQIRYLYLELLGAAFAPPQLVDKDGNQFQPASVYFELDSSDEAFHKLKDLAGEGLQEEVLKRATIKEGQVVKAEFPWVEGTDYNRSRFRGLLKIQDDDLIVEVYSLDRAEQIQSIVTDRLGDHARHITTDFTPTDEIVEEMWDDEMESAGDSEDLNITGSATNKNNVLEFPSLSVGEFSFAPDSPEVRAILKQLADEHWSQWYDIPVPALNYVTPREAAQTPEGRDLLESLLLEYEIKVDDDPNNKAAPDVAALRRELGMV
jgi:hypothetical protein